MAKTLYALKVKTVGLFGYRVDAYLLADHKNLAHSIEVGSDEIAYFRKPAQAYEYGLVFLENSLIHSFVVEDVLTKKPVRSVAWGY